MGGGGRLGCWLGMLLKMRVVEVGVALEEQSGGVRVRSSHRFPRRRAGAPVEKSEENINEVFVCVHRVVYSVIWLFTLVVSEKDHFEKISYASSSQLRTSHATNGYLCTKHMNPL